MTNKSDLIIILAVLGVIAFILYKSGIFKLTNKASEVASNVGDLANTALTGVNKALNTALETGNTVLTDIEQLPDNLSKFIDLAPDIPLAIEHNLGYFPDVAQPTPRAQNIVDNLRALYPSLSSDSARVQQMTIDGYKPDANGNIVDSSGNIVMQKSESLWDKITFWN